MNLRHDFLYFGRPNISVRVGQPNGAAFTSTYALLDTGSELSLFDLNIADHIGLDLSRADPIRIYGVGLDPVEAKLAGVQLQLLGRPDLSAVLEVAFASGVDRLGGSILGLDVLDYFDLALSHSKRIGYLGVTEP